MRKAFLYWAAVMELAGMVVGGALLGVILDKKLGTSGVLAGILTLLGFFGGVLQMWKIMKRIEDGKGGARKD